MHVGLSVCLSGPGCRSGAFCSPRLPIHPRQRAVQSSLELILVAYLRCRCASSGRWRRCGGRRAAASSGSDSSSESGVRDNHHHRRQRQHQQQYQHHHGEDSRHKRAQHNVMERQRRYHLKSHFYALRDALPGTRGDGRVSKVAILRRAVDHVRHLAAVGEHLAAERDRQRAAQERLKWKLSLMNRDARLAAVCSA